jgi:predicted HTH domain antitoxin
MSILRVELPDEVRGDMPMSDEELVALALEALLVRLYQRGDLSSGKAAELLHVSRRAFFDVLGGYGVLAFDEDVDLAAEAQRGRRLGRS